MTPWTVWDYYVAWKEANEKVREHFNGAADRLLEWMKNEEFDFSYFVLSEYSMHGLPEVHISGRAHSWTACYPETEHKKAAVSNVSICFMDKYLEANIMFEDDSMHDSVNARIPYEALKDFDAFYAWYLKELAQYKANKEEVKKREEILQTKLKTGLKKWLQEGQDFVDAGLVRVDVDETAKRQL